MKKKRFRKLQAGILILAMMTGLLSVKTQPVTVQAAGTMKTINIGASGLAPGDGTWDAANDHKVYFGQWGGNSTAFRVLKADADTMMLDCDTILELKCFDENMTQNVWKNSDLEIWLNGDEYYKNSSVFTPVEKSAIVETAVSSDDYFSNSEDYETEDYVYILSATEADTLYDGAAARVKTGCQNVWGLRSGCRDRYMYVVSRVNSVGVIGTCTVGTWNVGVSPVFNINPSSILFTSASGVSKSSDTLAQVTADSTAREWKLTLSDNSKTVAVTNGESVTESENIVTVPYTYTGSDVSQISVMITNGAYDEAGAEILYYGRLNTTLSATGTGTFTLPGGLPDGYKIYIMAEDVNENNYTDYASEPVEIKAAQTAKTPVANLSETTYPSAQSLILTSDTEGADIYYTMTTDGSTPADPAATDTAYTGAINLTGTAGSSTTYKIKAIAVKAGFVNSSAASFTYTIDVKEVPDITSQPQNVTVQAGNSAVFTVAATGTAPLTYQWKIDRNDGNGWEDINGAVSDTYTLTAADMSCNGFQYQCTVSNEAGSISSNTATLTVTQQTPDNPNPDTPVPDNPNPDTPVPDNPNPDTPVPDNPNPAEPGDDTPASDYENDSTSEEREESPKTGDNTPISRLFVLLLVSGAGLVFMAGKRYTENSR